jgi:phage shock protein C
MNRFLRSRKERKLAGLLGGLAARLEWDPAWLRLGFIALCIFTGFLPCILGYAVAWLVVDLEPEAESRKPEGG